MVWGRIGKGAQVNKIMVCRGTSFYAPMAKSCSMSLLNGAIFTACPSFFSGLRMLKGRWGKGVGGHWGKLLISPDSLYRYLAHNFCESMTRVF